MDMIQILNGTASKVLTVDLTIQNLLEQNSIKCSWVGSASLGRLGS